MSPAIEPAEATTRATHSTTAKLRLGYFVPEFPSQTHAFFWREVVALREQGVEVHTVSTRRPPTDACRHGFADEARANTHYLLPVRPRHALAALRAATKWRRAVDYVTELSESSALRRIACLGLIPVAADLRDWAYRQQIDHIHVHSCATSAHLAALCRLLSGPSYSLTVHGGLNVYGADHRSKMRHAAFVVAVTRPLQDEVRQCTGWNESRIPVVTMGINAARYTPRQVPVVKGLLRLVTVGRLCPSKGHRFVLEAMAQLRRDGIGVHYTIAGNGPHRASIEQEVTRLGLSDCVSLVGTISETEVVELLARSDVFILASIGHGEAAPVAVMEAMAAGLPVICSRIGGTPDMIRHEVDGFLVEQRDVAGIATRLATLAKSPERCQAVGAEARQSAVERFDALETSRQLLDAIHGRSLIEP
jgi:glycosyltransferase involved in cell wall biosynthesis